jgi:hypothetical protein
VHEPSKPKDSGRSGAVTRRQQARGVRVDSHGALGLRAARSSYSDSGRGNIAGARGGVSARGEQLDTAQVAQKRETPVARVQLAPASFKKEVPWAEYHGSVPMTQRESIKCAAAPSAQFGGESITGVFLDGRSEPTSTISNRREPPLVLGSGGEP